MQIFKVATAVRALSLAIVIPAVACSKKADDAVVVDTSAMGTPAPAPTETALRVAEIKTGEGLNADKTLRDDTDDFGVRDTIYVAVRTEGTAATPAQLTAKWTYQDGQTVEESSQSISPTGTTNHEFHLQKATAWPAGNYKVEIMLNGVSAGSKDFEIK
jgi:hypothetical protein